MELRILNIVVLLKKTRLKDGMGLILTYIGILPFFAAAILKPSKMAGGTQNIDC